MMTADHSNGECLLVTMDVAKRYHDSLVQWASGRTKASDQPSVTHTSRDVQPDL